MTKTQMKLSTAQRWKEIITDLLSGREFVVVSTIPYKDVPEVKTRGSLRKCYVVDYKNGNGTVGMDYTVGGGLNGWVQTGCDSIRIDADNRAIISFVQNGNGDMVVHQYVLSEEPQREDWDKWKSAERFAAGQKEEDAEMYTDFISLLEKAK